MEKEQIIQKLKENGFRITRQRRILLDVILDEDCSCCKEIYYKASKRDQKIGFATVYRMVNSLEDIGALERSSLRKIPQYDGSHPSSVNVTLDDSSALELSWEDWSKVIQEGLQARGYISEQKVRNVTSISAM